MDFTTKRGFLYINNSAKPDKILYESIDSVPLDSFSAASIYAAREIGYKLFKGISRKFADKIKCSSVGYDIIYYDQHTYRNPLALKEVCMAYKNACKLLDEHSEIKVIQCNTPIGGVIGRLMGRKYPVKVIYMVHGFHFYKGAPLLNWLIFYPIEKFLLRYTDVLITINSEDYARVRNYRLRNNGNIYYVPGIGINIESLSDSRFSRNEIREKFNLPLDAVIIVAAGRLDKNKNYALLIDAVSKMSNKKVHVIICGEGDQRKCLEKQIDNLKLKDRAHLLGQQSNIYDFYRAADIFTLTSFREGLSRSIMEAMGVGLPCVVTSIRGNVDLIDENKGGFCISPKDRIGFAQALDVLADDINKRKHFGDYNRQKVLAFSDVKVKSIMVDIFSKEIKDL